MEHRLFGTAHLVVVCEYWFLPSGWGQGKRLPGGVVPGTLLGPEGSGVFLPGFSVRALPAGRTAGPPEFLSGGLLAPAFGGVPPVF